MARTFVGPVVHSRPHPATAPQRPVAPASYARGVAADETGERTGGVVRRAPLDRSLRLALGDSQAKKFARLGLVTVRDLLEHYPRRAVDPGELTDLSKVEVGRHVMVIVEIASLTSRQRRAGRGAVVTIEVTDGTRRLPLVYFAPHQGRVAYLEQRLPVGRRVTVDGKVGMNNGRLQIVHPRIDVVDSGLSDAEIEAQAQRPRLLYGQTRGLTSEHIGATLRGQLDRLRDEDLPDPVPFEVRMSEGLLGHATALRALHEPETFRDFLAAQDALRFEEAFVLQAAMARRRAEAAADPAAARPTRMQGLLDAFDASLPFELTAGQLDVGGVISAELAGTVPMHRLLQGEVGSGKTLVALRAMLQVVDAGGQAALLAPTEVLAAQHERSIRAMLGPLAEGGMLGGADDATRVVLLTGSMSAGQRRKALAEAAGGSAGIVIGTHALLQEHVQFADLGLVVVDEQHRFGVEQRDALRAKGRTAPHLLVMTATPIPRTVAMTIFGDLEVSTLRDVPAGRAAVETFVVPEHNERWTDRMWQRVAEEVAQGRRAYVVCPRISASAGEAGEDFTAVDPDPDDAAALAAPVGAAGSPSAIPAVSGHADDGEHGPVRELASVEAVVERLRTLPALAGVPIGALHGRLAAEEKESAMAAFASGETPVLVSTTVVEVGVDVAEASVMVVLDADRFGLSQLHQLRGRIGRGALPGVCFAVSPLPFPGRNEAPSPSLERLLTFAGTRDGFALAEADLVQRREGDVLGAAQHGRGSTLRLLRVVTDEKVIVAARDAARALVAQDPTFAEHPDLAAAIERTLEGDREEFLERG